jgi:hypothetical protein
MSASTSVEVSERTSATSMAAVSLAAVSLARAGCDGSAQ